MRTLPADVIASEVEALFLRASYQIGEDITCAVQAARQAETSPIGRDVLDQILENNRIAATEQVAICQDTGMAVVFLKVGCDLHIEGGPLSAAVTAGVRAAYDKGYLRKSIVDDPLFERKNTGDNTPAVIYTDTVPGDKLDILCVPKGFGSENMSAMKMMVAADGPEGVLDFVVDTVRRAGPNPCPPVVVGVGIGGTMDKAAQIAKYATARPLDSHNANPKYAQLEEELLRRINRLGIGPSGTGGNTTALGVNIEYFPTHIAGMPVAVNICCHVARHAHTTL